MIDVKNNIEQLILELATSMNLDAKQNNAEKLSQLQQNFSNNEELYDAEIAVSFDNFELIAATPFIESNGVVDGKRKNIAYCIYGQQLPHFIRKTIENREGWPYSGDKERFIIRKLKEYIITGENQSLFDTYKDDNKRAYWSPTTFKDTDEVLKEFFSWYNVE